MTGPAEPSARPTGGSGEPGAEGEQYARASGAGTIVQARGNVDFTQHLPDAPPPPEAMRTLILDVPDFTGRDTELARLLAGANGVVAVHAVNGMAGVGKTALIRRAASLLADRFPDGQLFVDLHAHTPGQAPADPAAVLASLLDKTGLDPRHLPAGLDDRAARWRDRIAGRKVLLVLDDAASPAQIRPLLPGPGEHLVLITSRRRLDVEEAEHLALSVLSTDEAVELFVRVCRRTPAAAEMGAVEEIVRRCGRLPLAIVLLARRLIHRPAWTFSYLAERFAAATDRLAELRVGRHPEDEAVAAAFEMSYRDLTPDRRRLFRLLGLHPGLDIDAHAAAALADIPLDRARDDLDALYLDHLLIELPTSPGRYEMHDLLREYARTLARRDDSRPDRDLAINRLLNYYQHTAQAADRYLARYTRPRPPSVAHLAVPTAPALADWAAALTWMRTERANLLACIDHAARHDLYSHTSGLTAAIAAFLRLTVPWAQTASLHKAAATAAHHNHDRLGEANALIELGHILPLTGDYPAATERLEQALTIYQEIGNRQGEANALNCLGHIHYLTGNYSAAVELQQQALTIYQEIGDRLGEANALNDLGRNRLQTGDYPTATKLLKQSLTIYQENGNRLGEANTLYELGHIRLQTGDYPTATELQQQALTIYQENGSRLGEANTLNELGHIRLQTGDYPTATELLERALTIYQENGSRLGETVALLILGRIRLQTGDYPTATELLERALTICQEIGDRQGEAHALLILGRIRLQTGDYPTATKLLKQSLTIYQEIGNRQGEVEVLNDMGAAAVGSTGPHDALPLYEQALHLSREIKSPLEEAHALEGIARCAARTDDRETAIVRLREAVAIYRRIGSAEAEAAAFLAVLEAEEVASRGSRAGSDDRRDGGSGGSGAEEV